MPATRPRCRLSWLQRGSMRVPVVGRASALATMRGELAPWSARSPERQA